MIKRIKGLLRKPSNDPKDESKSCRLKRSGTQDDKPKLNEASVATNSKNNGECGLIASADTSVATATINFSRRKKIPGVGIDAIAVLAESTLSAVLVEGIIEASLSASVAKASAGASGDLLGASVCAEAHLARASAEMRFTPASALQAHVSALGAGAKVGLDATYIGANVNCHLAEAAAGPFAVRAGLQFGAAVEHGIPVLDMGPFSAPCCTIL
jgi:hypothetical protein